MPDLVLYDGVCGLCDRSVQFLLPRDQHDRFRFAPLQSALAEKLLARHGFDARDLDTIYVVSDFGGANERVRSRATAVLYALTQLGSFWSLAGVFRVVPVRMLNLAYDFVAARRYGWFGRSDVCRLPLPGQREKFLSDEALQR
ncbi:MAG: thiol-disulfide oxidoreductase DCC family protein [Myxococcaceae bacterium]